MFVVLHVICVCMCVLSRVWLCTTPWTAALQAPLSTGFSRQEYWSGLPFPSLGDLLNSGIKPTSFLSPALTDKFFTPVPFGKPYMPYSLLLFLEFKLILGQWGLKWEENLEGWIWEGPSWQSTCGSNNKGTLHCSLFFWEKWANRFYFIKV